MKKLSMLLLALTLVLTACGGSDNKAEDTKGEKTEDAKVEDTKTEQTNETKVDEKKTLTLKKGEVIDLETYVLTIKDISLTKVNEEKDALKLIYDFTNNTKEDISAENAIGVKGFQGGVETEFFSYSDQVDLDNLRKIVQPGATIKDVETAVVIENLNDNLELKIIDFWSNNGIEKSYTLENLPQYK